MSRRNRLLVLVLVAAVAAGVLVWRAVRDDRPHARVGAVVRSDRDVPAQWRRVVLVPGARFEVVAAVREDVTDDPAVHARQAPDGGAYVGLRIVGSDGRGPNVPDFPDYAIARSPRFTLVADGRRYPLVSLRTLSASDFTVPDPTRMGTPTPFNGWVAVAGAADRLSLETTWQDRTQRVDLRTGTRVAGDFAGLYGQRSTGDVPVATTSCGRPVWTPGWRAGPGVPPGCVYRIDRLAWTYSRGWAAEGRQWLVATVTMTAPSRLVHRVGGRDVAHLGRATSRSAATSAPGMSPATLDALAPATVATVPAQGARSTAALIFSVARDGAAHTLVLPQVVAARPPASRPGDAGTTAVTRTWRVTV